MLSKRFSVLFYLRKPTNFKTGKVPIYLRLTVDSQRAEISTQMQCEPSRWNKHAGRVIGTKEEVRSLNAILDALQLKVHDTYRQLIQSDSIITAEAIKNKLQGVTEKGIMILEVFKKHNQQMELLVGQDFAPGTLERYRTSLDHTRSFIQYKYNAEDLDIKKLDYSFISEYSYWLKTVRKCCHNTTMRYLSNFKKIVLHCVKNGWIDRDPFYGYKLTKKEVIRTALTDSELKSLSVKSMATDRLSQVRDIFLFSCYTGLSYVEVKNLKRSNIAKGMDGQLWIFTRRQKTDTPSEIPLLPVPLNLLNQYKEHPACVNKGLVLPVLSNQKMNAYLKEIGDVCGITKNMTFHLARHTFATTVTLNNGVPMETVSKMLGHKSIRQTQHYGKILNKKISEDMQALKSKIEGV